MSGAVNIRPFFGGCYTLAIESALVEAQSAVNARETLHRDLLSEIGAALQDGLRALPKLADPVAMAKWCIGEHKRRAQSPGARLVVPSDLVLRPEQALTGTFANRIDGLFWLPPRGAALQVVPVRWPFVEIVP